MAKWTAQSREDRRVSAPRQEDSSFSSPERKLATASPSGGGRDACATTTFERRDLLILFGLAVVTFGIYAQVLGHHFITFDDLTYIEENSMVNRGVTPAGLAWAFTTFYAGNWHPLTWISHMIDSQLFGMFAGGHLLVNALIHTANTLLLFWFLLRTTHARWSSALVAALFALHPLHVESVAWASERKDTLSTLFGLLALIAYTRYAEARAASASCQSIGCKTMPDGAARKWYAWTFITLALGLMAKPMLVTWPFVMLLLDYWPLGRFSGEHTRPRVLFSTPRRKRSSARGAPASSALGEGAERSTRGACAPQTTRLLMEKTPLLVLCGLSAAITFLAQAHGSAVRSFTEAPITLRLSNALVSYAKYLLLAFWPNNLAINYPFPKAGIPAWQIIGAALLLIAITALCVSQRKIRPYLMVGWLWFLGTLVPVIGLVQVGAQSMADRYFYVPSIGLFIAIVFGLADIVERRPIAPWVSAAIANVVLLALATVTNAQIHLWSDSFTLFEHALAVTPPNFTVQTSLGVALGKSRRYDEAVAHFQKALKIRPDYYDALFNMGVMRFYQGRLPEAVEYYQAAIHSQPGAPEAHMQLALVLWRDNRSEAACDEMRRASQLAPKDATIRSDLGLALTRLGRIPEAIDQLHEALRLNPHSAEAHNNLGLALLASGRPRESIPEFVAAMRLKPDLKDAVNSLRRAQAQLSSQK
jgi:Flp pilus assembly protein TadD